MGETSIGDFVDTLARITQNWCKTMSPLIADTVVGSNIVKILSTRRFKSGDQIILRDSMKGESPLYIDEVLDFQTLRLTSNVKNIWTVAEGSITEKTFNQLFLQQVYAGEPLNIPKFPAICIKPVNESSKFIALQTTEEVYNLQINIYIEDGNQENAGRWLWKMADVIKQGLKYNFFPLVGPYSTYGLIADAHAGDYFLKIANTSEWWEPARIIIENPWDCEELEVKKILDCNTVELFRPICFDYPLSSNPIVSLTERWIYNSWPSNITYGTVWKGTSVKSASIDWFAHEAKNYNRLNIEPHF